MNKIISRERLITLAVSYIFSLCAVAVGNPLNGLFDLRAEELNDSVLLIDRENLYDIAGSYTDAREAFKAISDKGFLKAKIYVAPSVYWLDDPDDPGIRSNPGNKGTPYAVELKCDSLEIIGLCDNPKDIVFAVNRGQTQGAVGNFTMFHFFGRSLTLKNLTFGNYCNTDLDYPRNPSLNRVKRHDAIVQAQIGICESTDRLFADNCRFLSRLNLCPFVGSARSLYRDCYFECTDDALSGSAVYLDCRFTFFSSKPFYSTQETGAVFLNCDIDCETRGTQYFTKIPGMVVAIDTRFNSNNPIELKWTRDSSPVRCYQSNITLNSMPVKIDAGRNWLWRDLTGSSALEAYKIVTQDGETVYNLPNLLGGTDGWDPTDIAVKIKKEEDFTKKSLLNRTVAIRIETDKKELQSKGDSTVLKIIPLSWSGNVVELQPEAAKWKVDNALVLSEAEDGVLAVSRNSMPEKQTVCVEYDTESKLAGAVEIMVKPYLRESPLFKEQPRIIYDKKQKTLNLQYSLKGNSKDDSEIIWYRSHGYVGNDTIAVQHGRGLGGMTYTPTKADEGCMLSVSVSPKMHDSRQGIPVHVVYDKIITSKQIQGGNCEETFLHPDFSRLPVRERRPGTRGIWCFDIFKPVDTAEHDWVAVEGCGWSYGKGFDAASEATGLIQTAKGARMSYIPFREKCDEMEVDLTVAPCKGGGQGFGSATRQYMDICLMFDPVELNGYALRIERTPEYDKAVVFSLMKYSKGCVSVISEEIASDCFRNPCSIKVKVSDGILTATASTGALPAHNVNPNVKETVELSSAVEITGRTGLCIQHTGSWGPSATVISDLKAFWK